MTEEERLIKDRAERTKVSKERLIEGCDPGVVRLVKKLNESGFATVTSCSGMLTDHGWKKPEQSYVAFLDESPERTKRIEEAAKKTGLEVTFPEYKPLWYWSSYSPCIELRTTGQKSDEDIHQTWTKFEKELLQGD